MDGSNKAVTRRSRKIILMKTCERSEVAGRQGLVQPGSAWFSPLPLTQLEVGEESAELQPPTAPHLPNRVEDDEEEVEEEELPFKSTPALLSTFIHVASAAIHRNPGRVFAALASLFIAFIGLSTKRARNPATAAQRRSSGGGARPQNTALQCIVGYAGDNQRLHLERP